MNNTLVRSYKTAFYIALLLLIASGVFFRFNWVNWSQGTNLHPDEYGLTNTLVQLSVPASFDEYFNTRLAPLSPYQKYDLVGQPTENGPDNRMRWGQWPIIILRYMGEITGNTGYDEIRLMGRGLSAAADTISLLLLFLIGKRLLGKLVGLLATALSALCVMQIQQAHFMTVDNFGVLFAMVAMYSCVRVGQKPLAIRYDENQRYRLNFQSLLWFGVFGIAYGMAVASRLNLIPLAGMIGIAAILSISEMKFKKKKEFLITAWISIGCLLLSALIAVLIFRAAQPMSFRTQTGDTTFFTFELNPDWVESMKVAQNESNGIGGGPPSEQWANRPAILFPLINIVFWGMGLPLGLTSWVGFAWSGYRLLRYGYNWRSQLLPIVWTGGYFLFMGTRFVKSMRYFLPIYPFLCLFAACLLVQMWQSKGDQVEGHAKRNNNMLNTLAKMAVGLVILGTLFWATAFVSAIYRHDHTRIQATKWILQNIPSPINIQLKTRDGILSVPIPMAEVTFIVNGAEIIQPFTVTIDGQASIVTIAKPVLFPGEDKGEIQVAIWQDISGKTVVDRAQVNITARDVTVPASVRGEFDGAALEKGKTYYLVVSIKDGSGIRLMRSVISNENWDEGLPFPFDGYRPFDWMFRGITMEVRWYDDENKREMFLNNLAQVDYIILPSQRAIWSACRIPLTYPMTLEYYRALFDGRLGFDLVAQFNSPLKLGPIIVSDLGGVVGWNVEPELPMFNYNLFAAEEAFSVYDHPPVWIFKKRPDFDMEVARKILGAVDLSRVVIQSPREATPLY